jgi:hypothetical protein
MTYRSFGLIVLLGLVTTSTVAISACSSTPVTTTTGTTTGTGGSGGHLPDSCTNLSKDEDEADLDCGGICQPCDPGRKCGGDGDCKSTHCGSQHLCLSPACADGMRNNKETDVDCGGSDCEPCPSSKHCASNTDCLSTFCNATVCACPSGMVSVPIAGGGGSYCIDEIEVTNAQYLAFYEANPKVLGVPAACDKNAYAPYDKWPPEKLEEVLPVVYVDWCDAFAFCAWKEIRDGSGVRKHLCGRIGGGPIEASAFANATESEWYNACSIQGMNDYPYGHVYDPERCNGADFAAQLLDGGAPDGASPHLLPVIDKAILGCRQGTVGLFQMSGNAAEWEDACSRDGTCLVRGGSFLSTKDELTCNAQAYLERRDNKHPDIGFRCCF